MHRVVSGSRAPMLALLVVCLGLWSGALSAQEPTVEVSGTLHITWIDDGSAGVERQIPTLVSDEGRVYLLEVPVAELARHGGALGLSGRRATLRVSATALAEARRDPGGRLVVESIEGLIGAATFESDLLVAKPLVADAAPTSMPFLTLLCRYADIPGEPHPPSHYEQVTSMTFPNAGHYWTEASGGRITMAGSEVRGWYTLPRPLSAYDVEGSAYHNTALLFDDCMAAADADVHFPDFEGINVQVNDNVGDFFNLVAYATVGYSERDGVGRSYLLTILSRHADLGTYIHEIGHTLGLPHSSGPYGNTYDSDWDVMSRGRWPSESANPSGVRTIGYHLDRLGWIPAERRLLAPAGVTTLLLATGADDAAGSDPRLAVLPLPGGEFYTLEARRREGYDEWIPAEGVVIHHVRTGRLEPAHVVDVDGNGEVNDAAAVWTVGERFLDRARQVEVSVDAEVGQAFRVTVRVAAMDSLHVVSAAHRHEVPFGWTGEIRDSAYVRTAGPNAATIAWSTRGDGRLVVETPSGVGSGWVHWRMPVERMAEGEYSHSIGVEATGVETPPQYLNPMLIVGPSAELAGAFAGGAGRTWAMADRDRQSFMEYLPPLRIRGPGAAEASWSVTRKPAWMQLSPESGTGDGFMTVSRSAAGMTAGSYTDSVVIAIAGAAEPAVLLDHLEVAGPIVITPQWAPASLTIPQESAPVADSVYVELSGPRADEVEVSLSASGPLYTAASRRTGSGWIHFLWTPGPSLPGEHAVQLNFQTTLDPATVVTVFDTLHVLAAPPALVVSSTVLKDTAFVSEWSEGAVYVSPEGAGAWTRPWSASYPQSSAGRVLLIDESNGTMDMAPNAPRPGARWIRWVRTIADRPAGAGEDTIRIAYADEPRATVVVLDSVWVVRNAPSSWVTITSDSVRPAATMGTFFQDTLHASDNGDGVRWALVDGALPLGVALDSITGELAGVPEVDGLHRFTASARSGTAEDTRSFRLAVTAPALEAQGVLDHLLGGERLAEPLERYLDLLGNRNGRVDVGDVHAWLLEIDSLQTGESGDPDDGVAALRALVSTSAPQPPAAGPPSKTDTGGNR